MTIDPSLETSRRAMQLGSLLAIATVPLVVVAACADTEDAWAPELEKTIAVPPSSEGGAADGAPETKAAPDLPCAVGHLCRVKTSLASGAISALDGRSKDDVWAAGTNGTLMHWSGTEWTALESDLHETLSSVVLTADEMWGVGGTLIVRRGLSPESARTARVDLAYSGVSHRSVAGIAPLPGGDIYFGLTPGFNNGAVNYFAKLNFETRAVTYQQDAKDPLTNNAQTSVGARAVFVVPGRAVWLVGDNGAVVRYAISTDADAGSSPLARGVAVPLASHVGLRAAWGYDDHLWAAGDKGTILHFDGSEWQVQDAGTTSTLNAIFGVSPTNIWAVGEHGVALHFDGNGWAAVDAGGVDVTFRAVWGSAPDDVWIGGDSGMFHWGALP
jgi:hypothetical protein